MSRFLRPIAAAAAAALTVATWFGAASAQTRTVVRGVIAGLDGSVLSVKTPTSTVKVTLGDTARVTYLIKGDITKVAPGSYVGTAAVPQSDGTLRALELQIFNDVTSPPEGQSAMDLAPGSSMTNAHVDTLTATTVDKIDGRFLTLTYKGQQAKVFVPAGVPVVTYEKTDRGALVAGAHVILFAVTGADGSLTTQSVNVGKDGLVPPM